MKKQEIAIRTSEGIVKVIGYVDRGVGIHRDIRNDKEWVITDLATGMGCLNRHFPTRREAEASIDKALKSLESVMVKRPECYADCVKAFNKLTGKVTAKADKANTKTNTAKGDKKMAKTNTKAKANTKATAKADTNKSLEKENKALKKELEILKKQIEELTRVEKTTIDTFDVEGYLASRDNTNRITPELVEAIANTEGLSVSREGKDEWLFVRGNSEEATRSRKDIFRAMSFKWSPNHNAWILAPYPLRSKKAWGAKKARKASANA